MKNNLSKLSVEQIKNYILLMLGAPVVDVFLTDDQLNLVVENAISDVKRICKKNIFHISLKDYASIVQEKALGHAMLLAGRTNQKLCLSPSELIEEGIITIKEAERRLYSMMYSYHRTIAFQIKKYMEARFTSD